MQAAQQEREVLAAVMIGRVSWSELGLDPSDFGTAGPRAIAEAIARMEDEDISVDLPGVMDRVPDHGALAGDIVAGGAYTVGRFSGHCAAIREASKKRRLARIAESVVAAVHDGQTADEAASEASTALIELSREDGQAGGAIDAHRALGIWVEHVEDRVESGDEYAGVTTGWPSLDRLMGGMERADLVIVGGRPSMGKTTFAMNAAISGSRECGVQIYSLEMPAHKLVGRMVSTIGRVSMDAVKRPRLISDEDWPKITNASDQIRRMNLWIDDRGGISVETLRARARADARERDIGLIVVDYLQLLTAAKSSESETAKTTYVSSQLKAMAKELDVPVIVLSQLSRDVERRVSGEPVLADLRQSGAIEQDADFVLFTWRPHKDSEDPDDVIEIKVAKSRDGETGSVRLGWDGAHNRVYEPDFRYSTVPGGI